MHTMSNKCFNQDFSVWIKFFQSHVVEHLILHYTASQTIEIVEFCYSTRDWNTGLVSGSVSFTSWGEGASLTLVDHPSSDDFMMKYLMGQMIYYIDQPCIPSLFLLDWLKLNMTWCDCSRIQTHNHLVRKQTLDHLAKLAKWLSCVVSTYLYSETDCMLLSCHVWVSEWIHTLIIHLI